MAEGRLRGGGIALLTAALALAAACRPGKQAPPPERFLPAAPAFALVIPELTRAAGELDALYRSAAAFPGAGGLAGQRESLAAQLGFDPFDPKALEKAGVDPARGLAVSAALAAGGAEVLLVLPVGDAPRLEDQLLRVAADRVGATVRSAEPHAGQQVVVLRPAAGAPPAFSYLVSVADRTALAAWGPGGPELVGQAAARSEGESLAAAAAWKAARAALSDRYALLAYSARGTALPAGELALGRAVALGASADARTARLALAVVDPEGGLRALAAPPGAAPSRPGRLDPDGALALRWDGDPAELGRRLVPRMPAHDRAWLAANGFDLQRDLFDQLRPGAAAVLSLSPTLDLSGLDAVQLRADPLRLVRFELAGEVKDALQAQAALARLHALAAAMAEPVRRAAAPPPAPGVKAGKTAKAPAPPTRAEPPGLTDRIVTPSGEIAWRLTGTQLAMAGGPPGALERLLARQAGGAAGFAGRTPGAQAALAGGLGGAVLDTQRLVERVRALPDEAFGTGPTGFLVRSVVERVLEPAAQLSAVSLRGELAPGALVVTLTVEAAPGAPAGEAVR